MTTETPSVHHIDIGPNEAEEPAVIITRCIKSFPEVTDGPVATIHYRCHGVESIEVTDPWEMGKNTPGSQIRVEFITGHDEYLEGVITEVAGFVR